MTNSEWDWSFRAAGVQVLRIDPAGEVGVKVVLDLGFGIYRTLKGTLTRFTVNDDPEHRKIATRFIEEWAKARQDQGLLLARTSREMATNDWNICLYQEDDGSLLGDAIVDQGLGRNTLLM